MLQLDVQELTYRCTGVCMHMFITELLVITKPGYILCVNFWEVNEEKVTDVKKDHQGKIIDLKKGHAAVQKAVPMNHIIEQ